MTNRRGKKKKETYLWNTIMVICAICTILLAVLVVVTVFNKIKKDSSQWEIGEESTSSELVIETEAVYGWVETEEGTKFREEDGSFAQNTWKEWNQGLYYLNEEGIMEKSNSIALDGQIFTFSDTGILKDIQIDSSYTAMSPEEQETGKESIVRSSEFYAYLDTNSSYEGEFYPIVYKKSASETEEYLGGERVPEVSSENSLLISDGWIYYLPQVSGSSAVLPSMEQGVCNKLFRMRPGESSKELIASEVTGYLAVDGGIYYASGGGIYKAETGTQYPTGEGQFQIRIENDACYLLDGMGNLVSGSSSGMKVIGDRQYKLDNGKISYVQAAPQEKDGVTYELKNMNGKNALCWRDASGQSGTLAQSDYGINSFCIAENWIYYSAYVKQGENGERFSQIYRVTLDGTGRQTASEVFAGNILNLYYYQEERTIYGEYSPESWKSAYSQIVTVGLDGTVKKVDDSSVRTSAANENMVLELLLASDGTLTCYENRCQWDGTAQTWKILESRPIQFSNAVQETVASSVLLNDDSSAGGGERETEASTEAASEGALETMPSEAPAETQQTAPALPPETLETPPSENIPRPGEVIGGEAPGTGQSGTERPSETVGGQTETSPVVIIPAL